MQSAIDNIKATYDYETCKEIVDHGCQSGVCSQHIYYGDTIEFFTKHSEEITSYIKDTLGVEVLKDIFGDGDGNLDHYMNDLTWTFIELVAMQVVDDYEDGITDLEDVAASPLLTSTLSNGYNPSRSMNESRYAQV